MIYAALLSIAIYSCNDDFQITQIPSDSMAPNPVSNVTVKNTPGGAIVYYDLPKDEDISYVKAIYQRNGERAEAKSSRYTDSLIVEGFGDANEKNIELFVVDRSNNESTATSVKVNPLTPPVQTVAATFNMFADFGGVTSEWENEGKHQVGIFYQRKNPETGEFEDLETYYSDATEGKRSIRGMDSEEFDFAVYFKDRWDNRSETLEYTLTPFFETELEKGLFQRVVLPTEYEGVFGWVHERMWDNQYSDGNGYSSPGGTGIWPHSVSFDLGLNAKLSRIRIQQRTGAYIFAEGNLRKFEVYGSDELVFDGSYDNWTLIGDFESIKPSGLPFGQLSNEDITVANEGEDFIIDLNAPNVRYVRIKVTETWAGGDNFQISELTIFGDNR